MLRYANLLEKPLLDLLDNGVLSLVAVCELMRHYLGV